MKTKSTWATNAVTAISILVALFPWLSMGQTPPGPSLTDRLKAEYKLTKMAKDGAGWKVIEAGTILVVQKAGILGVPPGSITLAPSKFQDGVLHSPGAGARMFIGNDTRFFDVGEKIYITKLDINVKGDKVSLMIAECDTCNGVASSYKSVVVFQFPQGYLTKAETSQIQDVISQVLSPNTSASDTPQGQNSQAQPQQQSDQPVQPQAIQLGQTVEEVQATLGQPLKVANVGPKLIYVYKELKITFVDGKVSDVQ